MMRTTRLRAIELAILAIAVGALVYDWLCAAALPAHFV